MNHQRIDHHHHRSSSSSSSSFTNPTPSTHTHAHTHPHTHLALTRSRRCYRPTSLDSLWIPMDPLWTPHGSSHSRSGLAGLVHTPWAGQPRECHSPVPLERPTRTSHSNVPLERPTRTSRSNVPLYSQPRATESMRSLVGVTLTSH